MRKNRFLLIPVFVVLGMMALSGCAHQDTMTNDAALLKLFRKADVSGDGKVSRDEFVNFLIEESFGLYDTNKNGYVTREEFLAGGGSDKTFREMDRRRQGKVTLEDVKATPSVRARMALPFDEADKNRNGYVSYDEFVAYRKSLQNAVR